MSNAANNIDLMAFLDSCRFFEQGESVTFRDSTGRSFSGTVEGEKECDAQIFIRWNCADGTTGADWVPVSNIE